MTPPASLNDGSPFTDAARRFQSAADAAFGIVNDLRKTLEAAQNPPSSFWLVCLHDAAGCVPLAACPTHDAAVEFARNLSGHDRMATSHAMGVDRVPPRECRLFEFREGRLIISSACTVVRPHSS